MNKATAKILFNVTGLMPLPTLTPRGAQRYETGITHAAANTFTRPNVPIGACSGVVLVSSIKIVPGTHTNSDTAEEVPIDLCGSTEQAFKTGTVRVPPPIPSIDEKQAIQKAIIPCPNLPGNDSKAGFAFALKMVFREFRIIIEPNSSVSQAPPKNFETMIPTSTPNSMNADHDFITARSVLPFLYCERAAEIDVGIMQRRDVPVATTIAILGSI